MQPPPKGWILAILSISIPSELIPARLGWYFPPLPGANTIEVLFVFERN